MEKKVRGILRLTRESLAQLIGLPKDVEIIGVQMDLEREVVHVLLRSNETVEDYTFEIEEGMQIPFSMHVDGDNIPSAWIQIYETVRNKLTGTEEGEGVS